MEEFLFNILELGKEELRNLNIQMYNEESEMK